MQRALENLMAKLAFGPEVAVDDDGAFNQLAQRCGLSDTDREFLIDTDRERLFVYRELIQGTLFEALRATIPRSVARLGNRLDPAMARFLSERGPQTHYLRDVTIEFLEFSLESFEQNPEIPDYIPDLARHEWSQILVGSMQAQPQDHVVGELALEQPVVFIEAARLMTYRFAVHELPEDLEDRQEPQRRPTTLLVYRNPEHEVRYLSLSPLAADILSRLLHQKIALGEAITQACAANHQEVSQTVIDGSAKLLADLAERGVLLGSQ